MKVAGVAVLLLLAACNSSSTPSAQSSTPVSITSSPADLRGDLPIQDEFGHGGFLHFPEGTFSSDPQAEMVADHPTALRRTTVQPYLFGSSAGDATSSAVTYDRATGRWLPVAPNQVSADGLRYAYTEWILGEPSALGAMPIGGRIHVVDVRPASDQVVYSFNGQGYYSIVNFAPEGIYFSPGCVGVVVGYMCGPEDLKLWRLDPKSGTRTKISDQRGSWTIAGGVAWMVPLAGPREVPDGRVIGPDLPNQLLRVDLSTGREEVWDREPIAPHQAGTCCWTMRFVGTDGVGAPLIVVPGTNESGLLRVTRPGQTEHIFSAPGCCGSAVTDEYGTWFTVAGHPSNVPYAVTPVPEQGLYLYAKVSGVRKISDLALRPAGTFG